jgi:large subunit ribosomal protein L15
LGTDQESLSSFESGGGIIMQLHDLVPAPGSRKKRKRVGRGPGSGMGKTSTRGHKGLKARAGGSVRPGFEGGQMPIYRRLPKRGFKNPFKQIYAILNLRDIDCFDDGSVIDAEILKKAGIVKGQFDQIKVLGKGELKKKLVLNNILVSESARQKIESVGGSIN